MALNRWVPHGRPGVDRRPGLFAGGVGVADRGDRAAGRHPPGRGPAARPLRGQGDHPDRPPPRRQHPIRLGRVRVAQRGELVGAATILGQPRPLQMDDRGQTGGTDVEVQPEVPEGVGVGAHLAPANVEEVHVATIVDSVTQAVCLVDELSTLPQLVYEIEVAGVSAGEAGLADGIRELIEHLRLQAEAIVPMADRLERIAPPL